MPPAALVAAANGVISIVTLPGLGDCPPLAGRPGSAGIKYLRLHPMLFIPVSDMTTSKGVLFDFAGLCYALQAISAHFLWLSYLIETWAVVSRLRDSRTAAARTVYGRLLAASLRDPLVLSHHPAAVGAYFRLLTLGLVYAKSCLQSVGSSGLGKMVPAGADALLLFDRILQAVSATFTAAGDATHGGWGLSKISSTVVSCGQLKGCTSCGQADCLHPTFAIEADLLSRLSPVL